MQSIRFVSGCALALALSAASLEAEEFSWTTPVSGNSADPNNWSPQGVPGPLDTAVFDLGSSGYTVNLPPHEVARLRLKNDTLTLKGWGIAANDKLGVAIQFGANDGDVSAVTLDGAYLYGSRISIAEHANSNVTINFNRGGISTDWPFGSRDRSTDELVVGAGGKATLHLGEGTLDSTKAIVLSRDSNSEATIDLQRGLIRAETGLVVGNAGKASIDAESGSRLELGRELTIGNEAGSEGRLSIDGVGSRFDLSGRVSSAPPIKGTTIGASGKGELSITGGTSARLSGTAVVGQNEGAEGKVFIDGGGTDVRSQPSIDPLNWIVGDAGQGELIVSGGAKFQSPIQLGKSVGGVGKLTIDGANTEVIATLGIGDAGHGEATISGGAYLDLGFAPVLGAQTTGFGRLSIEGVGTRVIARPTVVEPFDRVVVGDQGSGELNVNSGGLADLRSGRLIVAAQTGSTGDVTVDGAESRLIAKQIDIGPAGTGALAIQNQAQVEVWNSSQGVGNVNIGAGSSLHVGSGARLGKQSQPVTVSNAGAIDNSGGTIYGNVSNSAGGSLTGSGTITGALTQSGGTISPGNSPGTLEVGSLDIDGGTLVIEMNSAFGAAGGPIGWDLIDSLGMVSIVGPLTVELTSLALDNQPGDVFDFDPNRSRSWTIVRGGPGGTSSFDLSLVTLDTTGFSNNFAGEFSLEVLGANLALTYLRPVPEPGSLVLAGFGVVPVFVAYRRRRRSSR